MQPPAATELLKGAPQASVPFQEDVACAPEHLPEASEDSVPPNSTDELTKESLATFLELDDWDVPDAFLQPATGGQTKTSRSTEATRQEGNSTTREAMTLLREVLGELADSTLLDKTVKDDDIQALVLKLQSMLPPKEAFQAGMLCERQEVWAAFLQETAPGQQLDKHSRTVLQMVREGVRLDFVAMDHRDQHSMPAFKKKRRLVAEMLEKADRQGKSIEECMQGSKPSRVIFPNRLSAKQHGGFLQEEMAKLLTSGAIKEWDWPGGQPPHIIHGLAVVANRQGKLRMIVDARYLNAFLRYVPFHYEQLKDVLTYLGEGHYMASLDFTSGYHHLLVREDQQKYFGFAFQGRVYTFRALCFGVAPACRIFTEVVRAVHRPLRMAGMSLTALIDDMLLGAPTKGQALYRISLIIRLKLALGWAMGVQNA